MEDTDHNKGNQGTIVWQAEDFYYHPKNFTWYLSALLIALLIAGIPWIVSSRKDIISPIVILIALLAFIVYAGRKPQKKNFELSNSKLKIDSQSFDLLNFSRYWVETFETHTQITLIGVKRTAMPIGLCLQDKELTKKVLALLQTNLPESNPSRNPADWITRKIKF